MVWGYSVSKGLAVVNTFLKLKRVDLIFMV